MRPDLYKRRPDPLIVSSYTCLSDCNLLSSSKNNLLFSTFIQKRQKTLGSIMNKLACILVAFVVILTISTQPAEAQCMLEPLNGIPLVSFFPYNNSGQISVALTASLILFVLQFVDTQCSAGDTVCSSASGCACCGSPATCQRSPCPAR